MCLLKNGVGVILANGEHCIIINNAIIGQDICIDIDLYNGSYINSINPNLNIVKVYCHLSDKWQQVKKGYIYGLLKNIEDSELLFDYSRYKITIKDMTYIYCVGDNEYVCSSLKEAETEYNKCLKRVKDTLTNNGLITSETLIFETNEPNYKATMYCFNKNDIERDDVIFSVKIIMKHC